MKRKNFSQEEALSSINKGFQAYEKLVDQEIHYVFLNQKKQYEELVLKPHSGNYMHLCGVKYKLSTGKKLKPNEFYEGLKESRLSSKGIVKTDSTTDLKLAILPEIKCLRDCDKIRIVNKPTRYDKNEFSHAIKTRRQVFVLGLEGEEGNAHFVPKSLLSTKTLSHIDKGCQVHCIYSVDISTRKMVVLCKDPEFLAYEAKKGYTYRLK